MKCLSSSFNRAAQSWMSVFKSISAGRTGTHEALARVWWTKWGEEREDWETYLRQSRTRPPPSCTSTKHLHAGWGTVRIDSTHPRATISRGVSDGERRVRERGWKACRQRAKTSTHLVLHQQGLCGFRELAYVVIHLCGERC